MTTGSQPTPGGDKPLGQFLRPLRDIAAYVLAGATAVLLFVSVVDLLGSDFVGRTRYSFASFVNLATIFFPLAAVLLSLGVKPVHPKARLIVLAALIEYGVVAFFGVLFGVLFGVSSLATDNPGTAFSELLVRVAWLAVFGLAAYTVTQIWRGMFMVPRPQPQPGVYGQPPAGVYGQPYHQQPFGQQPYGAPPVPGQPFSAPPAPGQPFSAPPAPGQPFSAPPAPGQPYGAPPTPGQAFGGQPPFAPPPGQPPFAPPPGVYGQPQPGFVPGVYGQPQPGAAPIWNQPPVSAPPVGQLPVSAPPMGQPYSAPPFSTTPFSAPPAAAPAEPVSGALTAVEPTSGAPAAVQPAPTAEPTAPDAPAAAPASEFPAAVPLPAPPVVAAADPTQVVSGTGAPSTADPTQVVPDDRPGFGPAVQDPPRH
ncbi:hypothetical protein [Actinoplanes rectilineatus]|uniref:hypothetical protein n=1 Tax=Actinoplanes rectilineatus TaxID=113571 RepID=UPI000697071E|nr:hypothetical protein [Actinoplanes rectilineatus]